jgi:thermitase
MKKLLALALLSTSAFGAEYVVKIKDDAKSLTNLKNFGEVRDMNVSVGNFVVLTTEDKMAVEKLSMDPAIEYIEPNVEYKTFAPQDADFKKQWGLNNTGRNSGSIFFPGKKGVDVSALKAWGITKGDNEIKIAVIDTGVDYNHVDLKENIMINELELNGTDGVDDDGNGYVDDIYGYDFAGNDADPMDGHGHGTHCAGVIGASHNSQGIAGVMAKVKILPIKFLSDSGRGSLEGAVKSIDYAIQRGVQIMSNSWGGGGYTQALFDVIKKAQDAGILFIAAAGNESNDNDKKPTYPATYKLDNVVSVGAIDGKGKKASFSNWGAKTVHVFAPGVKIYSTVSKNKYKNMSGTSMACPHVSGVAGLLLASEPNMDYKEMKARLMSTSIVSDELTNKTASGYVDAYKALMNR